MKRQCTDRLRIRGASAALAVTAALMAVPVTPAVAAELPIGDLEAATQGATAAPVETKTSGIDLQASEQAPKYEYQVYYLDGMGDTWYGTGVMRYLFIRTDNPEADFSLTFRGCTAFSHSDFTSGSLLDIEDEGSSNDALRVPGGYVISYGFYTDKLGAQTFELYEESGSEKALAATFTGYFADYDEAVDTWIDDTIAKYTTSSMNPLEKMKAIADGLTDEFKYRTNDGTYIVKLATQPNDPFFISKRWDSYISPTQLCNIAERIGGFDDIHNCYYDSENWESMHAYCRVTYKGETRYFDTYPTSSTGTIDAGSVKKVDFGNLSSSPFDVPEGFKEAESQAPQPTEYKLSVVSSHGAISYSGSGRYVAGETVSFTISPFQGYEVSSVTAATSGGKSVVLSGSGTSWSFTMPDDDVEIKVSYQEIKRDHVIDVVVNNCSAETSITAEQGEVVNIYVSADAGYTLKNGAVVVTTEDGGTVAVTDLGDGNYSFIMPDGPVTVCCTATKDQETQTYKVHRVSAQNGTISVDRSAAERGATVTVTLTPDFGYEIDGLKVTTTAGETIATKAAGTKSWTFEMPGDDVTVSATFKKTEVTAPGDETEPGDETPDPGSLHFSDVAEGSWYYGPVVWAYENGVMRGYEGTDKFGPNDIITRAQMAGVLYNIAGNPEVDTSTMERFSDCKAGEWYDSAVSWAVQQGIFSGYAGTDKFGPNDPITREQIAVVLWRQAGEPASSGDLSGFPDGADTSSWANDAMTWAVDTGLFLGNDVTGELNPVDGLTRAQAAAVMMRKLTDRQ